MSAFTVPRLLLKRSCEFASASEGALADKDPSTLEASSGEIKSRSGMLMSPRGSAGYSSIGNRGIYSEILINRGKTPGDGVGKTGRRLREIKQEAYMIGQRQMETWEKDNRPEKVIGKV